MNKKLFPAFIYVLALALTGCANNSNRIDTSKDIEDSFSSSQPPAQTTPAPADVAAAMMPTPEPGLNQFTNAEPRFDVNANSVDARAFFMGLVKDTDYNMVLHPKVSGKISLTLKNVTVPEVMDMVRDLYGYDYRASRNGFMVLPAELQSRIYQVNYLDLNRSGKSETRVSSGQLSGGQDTEQSGTASGVYRSGGVSQVQVKPSTVIETEGAANFWENLTASLNAMVGSGEGRNVVVNAQTGVILVRAMPEEHRHIAEYLSTIQDSAQRQVVLEARIVEVELNEGFQAGINWAALDQSGSRTVTGGMVGASDLFEQGASALREQPLLLDPNGAPVASLPTSLFGGVFALAVNSADFSAFIELLDSQGDAKVLSSPRVSTVNNQKAVIKVGSDEFFVTGISSNTVTGTATNTNNTVQLTPFFSGIALDVTPQISQEGSVILHIHPSVSEVQDQRKQIILGDQAGTVPLAFSTVRESDSVIRAKSGQIVVIGGLMRSSTNKEEAGIPVLGDLPVVGGLFRHTREREIKTELVILLKPIVIGGDNDWDDIAREHRGRFSR